MQNLLADYCCGGTSGASARPPQQSLYANIFSFADVLIVAKRTSSYPPTLNFQSKTCRKSKVMREEDVVMSNSVE